MMWNIKLIKYRENNLIVTKYVFPYRCDIFIQLNRFYRTSSYASAVLAVVILWVRLSVCHTRALWQNQTMHCGYFDTTWTGNYSSFLSPTVVGGWRPLPSEICTQSHPLPSKNADFDRFPLITSQPYQISKRYLSPQLGYYYFRFINTNGRHNGILLPVLILTFYLISMSFCIRLPNYIQIGPLAVELWRHSDFHFSKWRPLAMLD